jgi:hypothetical protein
LKISLPDGQIAFAKYTGNRGDLFIVEELVTKEVFEIPLQNILDHSQPPPDVLQRYKDDLAAKKAAAEKAARAAEKAARAAEEAARAAEEAARAAEEAKQKSQASKAQMMKRGKINEFPEIQRNYPLFSPEFMLILFLLCKRFGIEIGFGYRFNLIVRRLAYFVRCSECFVRRSDYQHDQPNSPPQNLPEEYNKALKDFMEKCTSQFPEEVIKSFEAFVEGYMKQVVGLVIVSRTIRFQQSNLPDKSRGLFEIHCHQNQNYSPTQADVDSFLSKSDVKFAVTILENPLALPDIYWTQEEFGVLTKQKKGYGMCQFLFPMPKEFPKDIFE